MARMLRRLPRAVNGAAGRPERSPNRCDRRGTASAVQPAAIFAALIWSAGARRRRQMFLFKKLALAALIGASALTALPAAAAARARPPRHGHYGDRGHYPDYRPDYRRDYPPHYPRAPPAHRPHPHPHPPPPSPPRPLPPGLAARAAPGPL